MGTGLYSVCVCSFSWHSRAKKGFMKIYSLYDWKYNVWYYNNSGCYNIYGTWQKIRMQAKIMIDKQAFCTFLKLGTIILTGWNSSPDFAYFI